MRLAVGRFIPIFVVVDPSRTPLTYTDFLTSFSQIAVTKYQVLFCRVVLPVSHSLLPSKVLKQRLPLPHVSIVNSVELDLEPLEIIALSDATLLELIQAERVKLPVANVGKVDLSI